MYIDTNVAKVTWRKLRGESYVAKVIVFWQRGESYSAAKSYSTALPKALVPGRIAVRRKCTGSKS